MLNRTVLLASLVSGVIVVVQGQSTADDLPPCAALCAATAAVASGCLLNDAACLCAHPLFKNATLSCTGRSCTAQDNNSANDILTTMCANLPTSSSGSIAASTSISQNTTTLSTSASSSSIQVSMSAGSTSLSALLSSSISSSQSSLSSTDSALSLSSSTTTITSTSTLNQVPPQPTTSDDSSSTVVVVQTVVVGDPQTTTGAGTGSSAVRAMNRVTLGLAVGPALVTLGVSFAFGGWMWGVGVL